jgi:cysteine dioxygenase
MDIDPMLEKTVPAIPTLEVLIQELHKAFATDRVNVDYVKALLAAYTSNPRDWKKFAKFDPHRYTRNLIDEGNGKFNLMALCWGEGHGSSIHDHADAHCFVKVLKGTLRETMYEWPNESEGETEMVKKDVNDYPQDGVTYINDSMGLHRMENPSNSDSCVSMHLYSPPFSSCKIFDERTGHENSVKVTFYSQYGKRTPFGAEANQCSAVVRHDPENN